MVRPASRRGLCLALIGIATMAVGAQRPDGIEGDGAAEKPTVAGVPVSLSRSSIERFTVEAADGVRTEVLYRRPAGEGPWPAVVFLHGGIGRFGAKRLRTYLEEGATYTRFLARGYVVVAGDYRDYGSDLGNHGPVLDSLAVIEGVRALPFVDVDRIGLFGGSGGGSIALEAAGAAAIAAVVAAEPATIILAGLLDDYYSPDKRHVMRWPLEHYNDERRQSTRAKLSRIDVPILLLSGDVHQLKFVNEQILIPELEALDRDLTIRRYPGNPHGFYWGNNTDTATLERVVDDVDAFLTGVFGTEHRTADDIEGRSR